MLCVTNLFIQCVFQAGESRRLRKGKVAVVLCRIKFCYIIDHITYAVCIFCLNGSWSTYSTVEESFKVTYIFPNGDTYGKCVCVRECMSTLKLIKYLGKGVTSHNCIILLSTLKINEFNVIILLVCGPQKESATAHQTVWW